MRSLLAPAACCGGGALDNAVREAGAVAGMPGRRKLQYNAGHSPTCMTGRHHNTPWRLCWVVQAASIHLLCLLEGTEKHMAAAGYAALSA
jgi:hypothetical protein